MASNFVLDIEPIVLAALMLVNFILIRMYVGKALLTRPTKKTVLMLETVVPICLGLTSYLWVLSLLALVGFNAQSILWVLVCVPALIKYYLGLDKRLKALK